MGKQLLPNLGIENSSRLPKGWKWVNWKAWRWFLINGLYFVCFNRFSPPGKLIVGSIPWTKEHVRRSTTQLKTAHTDIPRISNANCSEKVFINLKKALLTFFSITCTSSNQTLTSNKQLWKSTERERVFLCFNCSVETAGQQSMVPKRRNKWTISFANLTRELVLAHSDQKQ